MNQSNPIQRWHVFLLIAVLGFLCFFPSIQAPMYYDDEYVIKQNLWIQTMPKGTWYAQSHSDSAHFFKSYRPTLIASYWLNSKLPFDLGASLRIGTLFLHILNACMLFLIILHGYLREHLQRWMIALSTALIFLIHPVQTIGVSFIWKRSSILCCTWMLLGLCFLFWRNSKSRRLSFVDMLIHLIVLFLAVTTKEEGVIYPILIWCTLSVIHVGFRSIRAQSVFGAVCFSAIILYLYAKNSLHSEGLLHRLSYFRDSLPIIYDYFKLMLIPQPRILDEPVRAGDWISFKSVSVVLVTVGAFGFAFKKRSHWLFICLCFIFLGFLPTQSFEPLFLIMDQIRMYVPMIGFSGILAFVLFDSPNRIKSLMLIVLMIGISFSTQKQAQKYNDGERIWLDVAQAYPKSFVAWDNLGVLYERQQKYDLAASAFRNAKIANPSNIDFSIREMLCLLKQGIDKEKIKQEFLEIPLEGTKNAMAILHGSLLASEVGLYEKAEKNINHFIKYYPSYAFAHYVLAGIYENTNRKEQSIREYKRTLELDSNLLQAQIKLNQLEK